MKKLLIAGAILVLTAGSAMAQTFPGSDSSPNGADRPTINGGATFGNDGNLDLNSTSSIRPPYGNDGVTGDTAGSDVMDSPRPGVEAVPIE